MNSWNAIFSNTNKWRPPIFEWQSMKRERERAIYKLGQRIGQWSNAMTTFTGNLSKLFEWYRQSYEWKILVEKNCSGYFPIPVRIVKHFFIWFKSKPNKFCLLYLFKSISTKLILEFWSDFFRSSFIQTIQQEKNFLISLLFFYSRFKFLLDGFIFVFFLTILSHNVSTKIFTKQQSHFFLFLLLFPQRFNGSFHGHRWNRFMLTNRQTLSNIVVLMISNVWMFVT